MNKDTFKKVTKEKWLNLSRGQSQPRVGSFGMSRTIKAVRRKIMETGEKETRVDLRLSSEVINILENYGST